MARHPRYVHPKSKFIEAWIPACAGMTTREGEALVLTFSETCLNHQGNLSAETPSGNVAPCCTNKGICSGVTVTEIVVGPW